MALPKIIILGAGLGGTIAAYEIRDAVKGKADVMVVNDQDDYWFVPSNPWVAVRWRDPDAIKVHLPPIMEKKGIAFTSIGAKRVADFGDGGVAFVAQPQIPPRNLNWSSSGKWVHLAKVGFEKYFLHKVRRGTSEPFYEKLAMHMLGIRKLRFK